MPPELYFLRPKKNNPKFSIVQSLTKSGGERATPAHRHWLDSFFHVSYIEQTMKSTADIKIDFPPQATGHRQIMGPVSALSSI